MGRFKKIVCLRLFDQEDGKPWGVKLEQNGVDNFTVTYGLQIKKNLDYGQASKELGECIMHHLACESLLDNREKGETNDT